MEQEFLLKFMRCQLQLRDKSGEHSNQKKLLQVLDPKLKLKTEIRFTHCTDTTPPNKCNIVMF